MSKTGVIVCEHAVRRYHERVRPGLDLTMAGRELRKLIHGARLHPDGPAWTTARPKTVAWILLGDDIALPLVNAGPGRLMAVTCLTRGGLSPETRAHRNRLAAARRGRRRAKRRGVPGRPHIEDTV